jgi:hypothetical protein
MNIPTPSKDEPPEHGLQAVHKQWALGTTRKLRFIHPELTLTLYRIGWHFTLHVENCENDAFPALQKYFDHHIRPLTCDITLSQEIPKNSSLVKESDDYEAEVWLNASACTHLECSAVTS